MKPAEQVPDDDARRDRHVERMLGAELRNLDAAVAVVHHLLLHALHLVAQHHGIFAPALQAHVLQEQWSPGAKDTESLYKVVVLDHAGTADDPIPYDGNMELVEGKYYTQDGATYLCTRSTGQPVYHTLEGLVGQYVVKAEAPSTEEEEQE